MDGARKSTAKEKILYILMNFVVGRHSLVLAST
jgi:hypothetical protein